MATPPPLFLVSLSVREGSHGDVFLCAPRLLPRARVLVAARVLAAHAVGFVHEGSVGACSVATPSSPFPRVFLCARGVSWGRVPSGLSSSLRAQPSVVPSFGRGCDGRSPRWRRLARGPLL